MSIGVGTALGHNIWGYLKGKAAKSSGKFCKMPSEKKINCSKETFWMCGMNSQRLWELPVLPAHVGGLEV